MPVAEVSIELQRSLAWLESEGLGDGLKTLAYPYGGFNDAVLSACRHAGFQLGWTTQSRVATLPGENMLAFPRLDTNEVPLASAS
jgi:peptidoglycan/xylan/chitin deacetylase (PgdA/CDA1 family)